MKFLFIFLFSTVVLAKAPPIAEIYSCPKDSKKSEDKKPVFLHQLNEKIIIGLCGTKEAQNGNYSDFDVYVYPETKKPIFSNHTKDRRFLVMDKKDGMLFIEKVKVDKEFVEIFKSEIKCAADKCNLEKEACIVVNKVKLKWILDNIKDSKVKKRMKKLGCK